MGEEKVLRPYSLHINFRMLYYKSFWDRWKITKQVFWLFTLYFLSSEPNRSRKESSENRNYSRKWIPLGRRKIIIIKGKIDFIRMNVKWKINTKMVVFLFCYGISWLPRFTSFPLAGVVKFYRRLAFMLNKFGYLLQGYLSFVLE